MPVRVDNNNNTSTGFSFATDMFEPDLFGDFDNSFASDSCLASYDLWEDLMPTPPQSPQFSFSIMESDEMFMMDEFTDKTLLHHDCMWSASCSEPKCSSANPMRSKSPVSFSPPTASSIKYFLECPTEADDILLSVSPTNNSLASNTSIIDANNVFALSAMENDHSYDSPQIKIEPQADDNKITLTKNLKSNLTRLTVNASGKITKIKCNASNKKMVHKKSPHSILHRASSAVSTTTTTTTKSVFKPTIIVASKVSLNDASKKLNFEIRNKKVVSQVGDSKLELSGMSPLISPSSSDSEESLNSNGEVKPAGPFKRREHNDSERKRRDHLRNSFTILKDQVPKLKKLEKKAPRIMILAEATVHVKHLNESNVRLEKEFAEQLRRKEKLEAMLRKLKQMSSS